jgi:hypothetical protein
VYDGHASCRSWNITTPKHGGSSRAGLLQWPLVVTLYGVVALTFMMTMYALERRGSVFVLAFAFGCLLSSSYGFLSGAWPFGVVEAIWAVIALNRYRFAVRT